MKIFVESNFVLELAFRQEQHPSCDGLLGLAESRSVELLVPAYALIEPYETLIRRGNERRRIQREAHQHGIVVLGMSGSGGRRERPARELAERRVDAKTLGERRRDGDVLGEQLDGGARREVVCQCACDTVGEDPASARAGIDDVAHPLEIEAGRARERQRFGASREIRSGEEVVDDLERRSVAGPRSELENPTGNPVQDVSVLQHQHNLYNHSHSQLNLLQQHLQLMKTYIKLSHRWLVLSMHLHLQMQMHMCKKVIKLKKIQ